MREDEEARDVLATLERKEKRKTASQIADAEVKEHEVETEGVGYRVVGD